MSLLPGRTQGRSVEGSSTVSRNCRPSHVAVIVISVFGGKPWHPCVTALAISSWAARARMSAISAKPDLHSIVYKSRRTGGIASFAAGNVTAV